MPIAYQYMDSPVGRLTLVADDQALRAVLWQDDAIDRVKLPTMQLQVEHPILLHTQQQLRQYFAGERSDFDLPLAFEGTVFQQQVWQALLSIPYGETRSYGQIAAQIGRPKAVRAVGSANAKNPLSIVVPCHRVIGANGQLVGFAGGLDKKQFLLHLESR